MASRKKYAPTFLGKIARVRPPSYGFIRPIGGGKDIFFHAQSLIEMMLDEIVEGDVVGFDVELGPRGAAATDITRDGVNADNPEDNYDNDSENAANANLSFIQTAVNDFCRKLGILISKDPNFLRHIEWRDLERIIADAFSSMGFQVELTPASKDGGKDIILSFVEQGQTRRYFVEIKHWSSGKMVGSGVVSEFLQVLAKSEIDGGLLLSSSGFSKAVIRSGMEIDRDVLWLGTGRKIHSICRRYAYFSEAPLRNPQGLTELIYEDTE